jgi:hypothetical protein
MVRRWMNVLRLASVVKMTTVLEEYATKEQRSVVGVFFWWAKWLNAKHIHEEIHPDYGGKCLSHKAVHSRVEKYPEGRSKVADEARPGAEVAETTVKRLLCCVFRLAGKAMGQVYQCEWRICWEIHFFPRFEYHMFCAFYPHTYWLFLLPLLNSKFSNIVIIVLRLSKVQYNIVTNF